MSEITGKIKKNYYLDVKNSNKKMDMIFGMNI